MNKSEFIKLIEETLEMDSGSLTEDVELENLDMWDSLAVVTFMAMVDENLDITLNPEQISEAKTISNLVFLVAHKLNG